jgi:hypothetical protein
MQGTAQSLSVAVQALLLNPEVWAPHTRTPGVLFCSAALLLYTAVIVPVQICLWIYDDPCNLFPTLYFDVVVDTFFLVPSRLS